MEAGKKWPCLAVLLAGLMGCTQENPAAVAPASGPAAELASAFDPAAVGTVQGRVIWEGPIPSVPRFEVFPDCDSHPGMPPRGTRPNPHAPQVNSQDRGVARAVVFLRRVDLPRSRPWDHEPVSVEQIDWQLDVQQGALRSAIGIVRRGSAIQAVSKQKVLHVLQGRGACWFSLPFPDADVVSTKLLERAGHVELASGAGYFWMRAHLFVADHPYYARSDAAGAFVLPRVPAGTYQVVCWLPNWNVVWRERDPESALVARIGFGPPMEKELQVVVPATGTANVDFVVSEKDFNLPAQNSAGAAARPL